MDRSEERERRLVFVQHCTKQGVSIEGVSVDGLSDDELQEHAEAHLAMLTDGQRRELLLLFLQGNREAEGWLFTGPSGRNLGNALRRWMKTGTIWTAVRPVQPVDPEAPLETQPEFQVW